MNVLNKKIQIFTGNSNKDLAQKIAKNLDIELGLCEVGQFSDGEISVSIGESVRGNDIYVVQPTSAPTNDNLMELLIMIDALKRASAGRINAVIPYYGYARQDRKVKSRDPITAKLVADLIVSSGANRVVTMDLHASQIQGYFDIPVDHLQGSPILSEYFIKKFSQNTEDVMVISPDLGGVTRARHFAEKLGCPIGIIDKRRPKANVSEIMNIIGDVKGKKCIMVDDMVDTGGTVAHAAKALKELGATKVYCAFSHPVFSGKAIETLEASQIDEIVFLDTIYKDMSKLSKKFIQLGTSKIFSEAIRRIFMDEPLTSLF